MIDLNMVLYWTNKFETILLVISLHNHRSNTGQVIFKEYFELLESISKNYLQDKMGYNKKQKINHCTTY